MQALLHQVLMDRRKREQRRDRDPVLVHRAVRDHHDGVSRAHGVLGLGAERREARLDSLLAPGHRVGDVELLRAELAAGIALDMADLLHLVEVEHRLADLQPQRRIHLVDAEQVRLRSDEGHQRGHHLLADRIDRGIGHLREQLLEIVVERLVLLRQDRQCAVVAHRAGRLLARGRHRQQLELEVLLRVGEGLLAVEQRHGRALGLLLVGFDVVEADPDAFDPFGVGLGAGERLLEFLVVDDAALFQVDEEHLARLEAPLLDDALLGNRQTAALRTHDHQVVVGDDVARRPQAVPVERRANLAAVGEGDRCRAIPGLHHRGVVFVERAAAGIHQRVVLPRFRDHHHHGVGDRVAAHHQQFQRVVEGCRIRLAGIDQRPDLLQVVAQHRAGDGALARADPVDIATHRVDLAVVADHAERVRQVPRREGVGREALVHQRQR